MTLLLTVHVKQKKTNHFSAIVGRCHLLLMMVRTIHNVFTRESSYCFQRVLAIAILSVRPSVCHMGDQSKTV